MKREFKYRPLSKGKNKEDEDALYQFILDHSTPVPQGFHIQFYIRNRKDFFTRVAARKYGLQRLVGVNEEWKEVYEKDKKLQSYEKLIDDSRKIWWKYLILKKIGFI